MPAITFVIYVAGGLHSHIIYSFFEQVFYPHSYTWGRTGTCVKGEFDAPAEQPIRQAKQKLQTTFSTWQKQLLSHLCNLLFLNMVSSTISCKGLVFRLSTVLNSLSCHGDDDLLRHNC